MASLKRRLGRLEDLSREHAVGELRRAWASLSDKELAILLTPYAEWLPASHHQPNEPSAESEEIHEKAQAAMSEELCARAIGLEEDMEQEEIDQRIHELVEVLGILKRGEGIRRHMLALGKGDGE